MDCSAVGLLPTAYRLLPTVFGYVGIIGEVERGVSRRQGEAWPIGFPAGDVFSFDSDLLNRLENAAKGELASIWRGAHPYADT